MKLEVYAVHDTQVEAYMTPFFVQNDNVAIRSFQAVCSDPDSQVSKTPEHYSLFHIGTFDDSNGSIVCDVPRFLINGIEVPRASKAPFEETLEGAVNELKEVINQLMSEVKK